MKATDIFSFDFGIRSGFSYESFSTPSRVGAKEFSGFGSNNSLLFMFLPIPRLLLSVDVGAGIYSQFTKAFVGGTMAFVIYPEYLPFIGINIQEQFYNHIGNYHKIALTAIYGTLGSKIFTYTNHSLWLIFNYLIFQTSQALPTASQISLDLAYTYSF